MRRVRLFWPRLGVRGRTRAVPVFVHLPKTAGSSLRRFVLRNVEGPSFRIIHPVADAERLASLREEERSGLRLVEGHLYYGVHEVMARPCDYFTVLRDPVERVLSYYSFVREYRDHHLHRLVAGGDLSLGECIERGITVELDNHMTRTLSGQENVHVPFGGVTRGMLEAAKGNLATFAAVGVTERFGDTVALLRRVFGWRGECSERENVTGQRLRRGDLDAGTLAQVEERNALDRELYEHARGLMVGLMARHGVAGAGAL